MITDIDVEVASSWLVPGLRRAALTPEESVHYRLDTEAGAKEWRASQPRGRGVVFPDNDEEPYRIAMFHQVLLARCGSAGAEGQVRALAF